MVIRDANDEISTASGQNALILPKGSGAGDEGRHGRWPLAAPVDRFAAVVIDYFITLLPFLYLVLAPFQRAMKQAAIVDDDSQISISLGLAFAAGLFLILFYQTMCVWLWGATLGKALMGLRVHGVWGRERVTWLSAFSRACAWVGCWVFGGVPFFAMSSNARRRPFHDRVADTIVVAVAPGRGIGQPGRQESLFATSIFWVFAVCLSGLVTVQVMVWVYDMQNQTRIVKALEDQNILCREVSEAQAAWPQEVERLEVALSMYAALAIDRKCLQGEVEALFSSDAESTTLYLAKSFVYSEHAVLSDLYLEKVCELDAASADCRLTRVITAASSGQPARAKKELLSLQEAGAPAYVAIWAIHQLMRHEDFSQAERMLASIPALPVFSDFVVTAKTKILRGQGQDGAASGAEATAYAILTDDSKLELASFMCFEQVWDDCSAVKSLSCQTMNDLATSVDDGLSGLKTSLAYLHKWECEHGRNKDYESLLPLALHPDVRLLTAALAKPGSEEFLELAKDPALDDEIASEISRRILDRTQSEEVVDGVASEWAQANPSMAWSKVGVTLFNKYFALQNYRRSLKVMEQLNAQLEGTGRLLPKAILERGLVAAVRGGQNTEAQNLLERYAALYPLPEAKSGREPASEENEFRSAVKRLRGKHP